MVDQDEAQDTDTWKEKLAGFSYNFQQQYFLDILYTPANALQLQKKLAITTCQSLVNVRIYVVQVAGYM